MILLLAHLFGDYIFQSHKMATSKTSKSLWALYHAFTYTLPFLLLTQELNQLFIICFSHFLIDRFRLAIYIIKIKNFLFGDFVWQKTKTGYPEDTPAFLSVWLVIIADNTLHLLINYLVLN
jgi:GT2 family glycosyltransferase